MEKVNIILSKTKDGTYSAYCADYPALLGMGNTIDEALTELRETLRIIREDIGKETAAFYPDWLDSEYEFNISWNIQDLLEYYAGIITPSALGRISGINPKQIWSYMHGKSKPRRTQIGKIESALHKLGRELINASFLV